MTDPSGGTISGANVKVTAVDTGISQERKTNSNGYYRFPGLPVGQFTVAVSNTSFKTKVIEQVTLQVGETHTLDVCSCCGRNLGESRDQGGDRPRRTNLGRGSNGN